VIQNFEVGMARGNPARSCCENFPGETEETYENLSQVSWPKDLYIEPGTSGYK